MMEYFFSDKAQLCSDALSLTDADGKQLCGTASPDEAGLFRLQWPEGELTTSIHSNPDGSYALRQTCRHKNGISAVGFGLSVSDQYDLIIPAWGGIRLSAAMPDIHLGFERLTYPDLWQAQMLLIQGENEGMLIYAADNGSQFKALGIKHSDSAFTLTLETIPQAPFRERRSFETAQWRFIPYQGDWQTGARLYKAFADQTFGLPAANRTRPAWTKEIKLALLTDIEDIPMLEELGKRMDPSKVMLVVPGWRRADYDTAFPDYTPNPVFRERIKLAKQLGYRVCLYFNMLGAALDSVEYKEVLHRAHSLHPVTGEPIMERYSAGGRDYAFSQLNPASSEWQQIFAKKAQEVVAELGIDAIHLDQSLLCFNDGRGLVEGMTSMQGNARFQQVLAKALPGIAFSGEGINEFNMQNASFLQMHVYGLDSGKRILEKERLSQICPLWKELYGEYLTLYHYPAMPTTTDEAYYLMWQETGAQMELLPTLMRINADEVRHPNHAMRIALDSAK